MKFLCDRCKTRYSIGDDRVRGKILKIRCKNCANVITVREGMSDADAGAPVPDAAARAKKSTTMAPAVVESSNALGAAFANAMTKPPPALEEEWYVSIDGDQSGPFSLAEAQKWVASKSIDADLHCWSEGFDDWLPVDKVSHFRGLRKRPTAPPGPPPLPRVTAAVPPLRSGPHAKVEEEPKPLFAATMASLEKSAAAAAPSPTPSATPSGSSAPVSRPLAAKAPNGAAKPNGAGAKPAPQPVFDSSDLGLGDSATTIEPLPFDDEQKTAAEPAASAARQKNDAPDGGHAPSKSGPYGSSMFGSPGAAPTPAPSPSLFGSPSSTPAAAPAAPSMFGSPGGAPTTVPLFGNAAPSPGPMFGGAAPAVEPPSSTQPPMGNDDNDDDDGLDIGEVSRVVKLADIARGPSRPRAAAAQPVRRSQPVIGAATGPVGRMTGANPRVAGIGTGAVQAMPGPITDPAQMIGADGLPVPMPIGPEGEHAEGQLQPHAPAISHKRGMIMLIAGAVALIGILLVVVLVVTNTDEGETILISRSGEIDTTGRDFVVVIGPDGKQTTVPASPGSAANPLKLDRYKPPGGNTISNRPPELPKNSLSSDDITAMANQSSSMTTTCWRRARKGAEDLYLSDVKRITVSFTVAPDGSVKSVNFSGMPSEAKSLPTCLGNMVRGWKFRPNAGGTFGFTMVPPS